MRLNWNRGLWRGRAYRRLRRLNRAGYGSPGCGGGLAALLVGFLFWLFGTRK